MVTHKRTQLIFGDSAYFTYLYYNTIYIFYIIFLYYNTIYIIYLYYIQYNINNTYLYLFYLYYNLSIIRIQRKRFLINLCRNLYCIYHR